MEAFLTEWGTEIILSLIITMLGYFLKRSADDRRKQDQHYQTLLQGEEETQVAKKIEISLEPVYKELEDIRKRILVISDKENADLVHINENFDIILASYKYRLVQLCKQLLEQGFMYQEQYENLNEFYTLYHKLGGNGQAQNYYEKCSDLEIKPNPSHK